jgi:hypothetical protein
MRVCPRLGRPRETKARAACGCVKMTTSLRVSLYSGGAACYLRLPYRHPLRQAAGPLIENLPIVLTGDREPVGLYSLPTTVVRLSVPPSPQIARGGPHVRFAATARSAQAIRFLAGSKRARPRLGRDCKALGTTKRG